MFTTKAQVHSLQSQDEVTILHEKITTTLSRNTTASVVQPSLIRLAAYFMLTIFTAYWRISTNVPVAESI